MRATNSSGPLPLYFEKPGQARRVRTESIPGRAKLPHAVLTILADAFGVYLSHWDDRVDAPVPACKLNAYRTDLDFGPVVLQDDAVIIVSLGMYDFAEK
jgi:hypothetical protein